MDKKTYEMWKGECGQGASLTWDDIVKGADKWYERLLEHRDPIIRHISYTEYQALVKKIEEAAKHK